MLILLLCAGGAEAFHRSGVANCTSCHVMHETRDGNPVVGVDGALLLGLSPSDVCLNCHADGDRSVFGGTPLAPPPELGAGNFIFLIEDQINDDPRPSAPSIAGHHAGHSIVAPGYGLAADPDHLTAPGGTFPSSEMGCTSCHDPHGNTNFRMLHGVGPVQGGLFDFIHPAPLAEGLPVDLPGVMETSVSHTAYRGGMSWWCANCHDEFHDRVGDQIFEHEFNEGIGGDERDQYNIYDGDLNPAGGSALTSYLVQVPFEDPASTTDKTSGPGSGARVMCLTCHRAHATSAPGSTRWDMRVARLGLDGQVSGSLPLPNPYGDPNQKQLCLKCHDEYHAFNSPLSCFTCHSHSRTPDSGYGLSP